MGGRTVTGGPPPDLPTATARPARCPPGTVMLEEVWRFGSAYRGTGDYAPDHWDTDPYRYGGRYGKYVYVWEGHDYWFIYTADKYSRRGNYWLEHIATYTFDVSTNIKVEVYVDLYKIDDDDFARFWLDFPEGRWVDLGRGDRGARISGWYELGTVDGGTHTVSLWFRYGGHRLYAVGLRLTCT